MTSAPAHREVTIEQREVRSELPLTTSRPMPTQRSEHALSDERSSRVPGVRMEHEPKPLTDYPELMTVAEAAEYLRVTTSTTYLLTQPGAERRLPAVKVGGRTFILRDRLTDYLQPQP